MVGRHDPSARVVRRYDLSARVVRAATEHRLAGDWRAACAAARVDLESVAEFADVLRHLAPELLRWHLIGPTLAPVTLREWELARSHAGALFVRASMPPLDPARITLSVADGPKPYTYPLDPCLWDVRYADRLPIHLDGGPTLNPWYLGDLRAGRLTPAALPPLVRTALYPHRPDEPYVPAPGVAVPDRIHVQCHRARHYVGWRDGALRPLSHPDAERERVLHALGAHRFGCFDVEHAWNSRRGRLPRQVRAVARHLFLAVAHGDADEVTRLLDAGVDPRGVRGPHNQSLLHVADGLDPAVVLRLLDAGLDPDLEDFTGRRTTLSTSWDRGPDGGGR
jgi:hypothetical protein